MPVRVGEFEMVRRTLRTQHHPVETVMVGEAAENGQAETGFIETHDRVEIVGGARDP